MRKRKSVDKFLLIIIISLVVIGFLIFISASFGLLAKDNSPELWKILLNHIFFGLILGGGAAYGMSIFPYSYLRTYSFYIYIAGLILTLAVFIPGLGFSHGGATRWLSIGPLSVQPAEFLKIAYIIYLSTWLYAVKDRVKTFKLGLLPFAAVSGLVSIILLLQPDTDTLVAIIATGTVMYFVAGASWKHIGAIVLTGLIGLSILAMTRPYILDRFKTFIDPSSDPLNSGYQIQQSLIAIGSGGVFGKGFGQSVQKFNFLPEPTSDSIFAVAAEEFGIVGSLIIIILYLLLIIRIYTIASKQKERYAKFLSTGIGTLIVSQSFINIAAMLGLLPLSGLPLLFVSHGGTALFFTLLASGIVLNISRRHS